jgi:hypothetical protein
MRQLITRLLSIVIALAPVILVGCGSERQDLGGKATLKIACPQLSSRYGFLYLHVTVNGEPAGKVEKGNETKDFVFNNAKNGKNTLILALLQKSDGKKTGGKADTKEIQFTAMPDSVIRVDVTISGIIWCDIEEVAISTAVLGGDPAIAAEERARKEKAAAEESARNAKAEAELESEYQKFAKEFVPDLQRAIERYEEQIKQFTEQRAAFAAEMARLKKDPEQRPAYVRQKEIIDKMAGDVKKLRADREETYIRWKELNLLRDTAEAQEQRDKLLRDARRAARSADETFDKYMKQSEDAGSK